MPRDSGFPHDGGVEVSIESDDKGLKVAALMLALFIFVPLLVISTLTHEEEQRQAEESLVEYQSISLDTTDTIFLLTEDLPLDTTKYEEVGIVYRRKNEEE